MIYYTAKQFSQASIVV